MIIFYHNDLDGECAAYWVWKFLHNDIHEIHFIEMDYGKRFPLNIVSKDEPIWILDYSISTSEMEQLLSITNNVVWIDHHKTAIAKYDNFTSKINGLRYDGIAGCDLTYMYLSNMYKSGKQLDVNFDPTWLDNVPMFTRYIGDRDVWKFVFGNDTNYFTLGLMCYNTSFDTEFPKIWEDLFEDQNNKLITWSLINAGKSIQKFNERRAAIHLKSYGHILTFEDHTCFALNKGGGSTGDFKNAPGYDIYVSYVWDGSKWRISLRSSKVDVSEIAKKYGGGGHKGAAGFECQVLPWKIGN
jgi:oligoribonuclease NrnB/cAMP/cGMP phosphodiesterase (DHH superfamily)